MKILASMSEHATACLLSATVGVLTVSAIAPAVAQEYPEITLRSAQAFPSVGIASEAHQWWADEIARRTDGNVNVDIFWGGSLVSPRDIPAAVSDGAADIGHVPSTYDPARTRLWMTLDLPFNVRDHYCAISAGRRVASENENLSAELAKSNMIPLVGYSSGFQHFLTKDPVTSVAGLEGRRMRTYGGARVPFLEELGITPVFMPFSDIYEALDRGVLDGSADVASYLVPAFKLHEVASEFLIVDSGAAVAAPLATMSRSRWDQLPDNVKEVFREVGEAHDMRLAQALVEIEQNFLKNAPSEYGITLHQLGEEEFAKLEKAAERVREAWIQQAEADGLPARDVWEHFQRLQRECEENVAANGYPWES